MSIAQCKLLPCKYCWGSRPERPKHTPYFINDNEYGSSINFTPYRFECYRTSKCTAKTSNHVHVVDAVTDWNIHHGLHPDDEV